MRQRGAAEYTAYATFRDHCEFAKRFYRIADEQGQDVPFLSFELGRRISQTMDRMERDSTGAGHLVVLKPRRAYASAHIASEVHRRTAFYRGRKAVIAAQQLDTAREIMEYCVGYDRSYREARYGRFEDGVLVEPPNPECLIDPLALRNTRLTDIPYVGGGKIKVTTAKSPQAMRGQRANMLVLSEAGYYGNAFRDMLKAVIQCVPKLPRNWVILESTASGQGNPFHQFWLECRSGRNEWAAVFIGTHEIERYQLPVSSPERFLNSLTPDEVTRMRRYKLRPEQIAWYRYVLANTFHGNVDNMRSEYPYDEDEAFVGSGRSYFDLGVVGRQPTSEPNFTGLVRLDQTSPLRVQPIFEPRSDGRGIVRVWELPKAGERYSIGADPATGKDVLAGKGDRANPDYSVASVHKLSTGEQVASLRARLTSGPFAEHLKLLAWWYNWAFLTVEINNYGQAVMEHLTDAERLDFPPDRLYLRARAHRSDAVVANRLDTYGFETTARTRIPLLEKLARAMRDGSVFLRDPLFKSELATFVFKDDRPEHEDGCHDDCVFAAALAVEGYAQAHHAYELAEDFEEADRETGPDRWRKYR